MALQVLPLVLLGVGVLVLRGRRRPKKKTQEPPPTEIPIKTVVFIPPKDPPPPGSHSGQPGQPCDAPDGTGALDEWGQCKTFWIDGETDDAIRSLAREEWEARGRPEVSELCLAVFDELGGEFATYQTNPNFLDLVTAVLRRYYGVGPTFPPVEAHGADDPMSPYWVHVVWDKAVNIIQQELCGG